MRYNTGNPVGPDGSSSPFDLHDNAGVLDLLLSGPLGEYLNRLGVPLKSWVGIMQQVTDYLIDQGYESVYLAYGAGVVVQRQTQLVQRSGELYRVMDESDIPLTLTGTWATDAPKLQAVGDAALRQALASPTGSTMVKDGDKTVAERLLERQVATDKVASDLAAYVASVPPQNRAQPLIAKSYRVQSVGQGVVNFGDSISAAAYFGNAYTNGWPYLLAKSINQQFGAQNIGVLPMDSLYNVVPAYNTDQWHAVSWTGDWGARTSSPAPYNFPLGNVGTAAGDAVNGKTVTSTNSGAYVEIVCPAMQGIAVIYYVGRADGGAFGVTVNGVAAANLNTQNAVTAYNLKHTIILADNGQGETVIRLTKLDTSPTEIQAIVGYQKGSVPLDDHFRSMNVCNYSVSGRSLTATSQNAIIVGTNCACFILSLGYNDRDAETDDALYALFVQRINWVIQYAKAQGPFVVVNDFCWYSPPSSRIRTQLRRVAAETKGIYIPYPDRFNADGTIVANATPPAATALVSDFKLFADNAHPNYKGNEMIFTQVANALGLSINSRRGALLNDIPFPLKLQGTLKNKAGSVSTITRTNRGLLYSLGVTATGGGTIPSGALPVAAVPAKFMSVSSLRSTVLVNKITSGAIDSYVTAAEDGSVSATIVNASEISTSFIVAEK